MPKNTILRAYTVQEKNCFEAIIVFALTRKQARLIGFRNLDDVDRYIDIIACRIPEADSYINKPSEPSALNLTSHQKLYRSMGWQCEGDKICMACSLYTLDDDFPICSECEQCDECGHDSQCPKRKVKNDRKNSRVSSKK